MAVPAHDDRDWEFAKKFGCDIIEVVAGGDVTGRRPLPPKDDTGTLVNSDFLNGLTVQRGHPRYDQVAGGEGHRRGQGQLQAPRLGVLPSALLGRAHPHCPLPQVRHRGLCPRSELPLLLPEVESYEPTDDGESPLAAHDRLGQLPPAPSAADRPSGRRIPCPSGQAPAWYFLRYMDPHNDKALALPGGPQAIGLRWTGTTAAWSIPPCTCSIPGSGTSSSTTSAWCPLSRALCQAYQPRHDPGQEPPLCGQLSETQEEKDALIQWKYGNRGPASCGEDVQVPGQRGQSRRRHQGLRRRHHAHRISCSSATLRRPPPGPTMR